ncbi:hypothetical protein Tco_1328183 [Tanacetum coccineum]
MRTWTKPNEYISVSRKNFLSNDNKGKMVEKSFLEIQGIFLMKIRDNTFNGIIGENAFKHVDNFLEVVGPLKIKGVSQDRFRLSIFPISLAGAASEWFKKDCIGSVTTWEDLVEKFVQKFYQLSDNNEEMEADEDDDPNDIVEIFKIEDNLFDFKTPLCKAFNEFNYLLKIDMDLFTFNIQGIKTYDEYELNNNMTRDFEELMTSNNITFIASFILYTAYPAPNFTKTRRIRHTDLAYLGLTSPKYIGVRYKEFGELIQPFKDPERVSQLDRKLLKTIGLDCLSFLGTRPHY